MPLKLDRYNQRVRDWTKQAVQGLKEEGRTMGINHRAYSYSDVATRKQYTASNSPDDSLKALRSNIRTVDGAAESIGFKVRRSLIYTHKGAGRGRGGVQGSKWFNAKGEQKKTAPTSFGKMGTGGRVAKPWFNQFMEGQEGVNELADIVAEEMGDAIAKNILIQ